MNRIDPNIPVMEHIELTPLGVRGELVTGGPAETGAAPEPFLRRHGLFLATVAVPLLLAAIYYFLIASDRYLSEARFIVRSSSGNGMGSVTSMIQNQGISRASDETYAVNDYLASRDIVELLVRNDALRQILARPEGDVINRFPNFYTRDNGENLYDRYKEMVHAGIDGTTGISTVEVVAFRPEDARSVAAAILKYAEDLINRLNARAYDDAERYALAIVEREKTHVAEIETQLTDYRNASGSVNPGQEATAQFELVGKMATELSLLEAELDQQIALAPANPGIPSLRERVRSYRAEIDKQKLRIVGGNRSLATKLAGFEKLELERELAARALALATVNLAAARADAQQQHLYLQPIVVPSLADESEYPRRWLGMLIVLAASLGLYSILRALRSITLEHRA